MPAAYDLTQVQNVMHASLQDVLSKCSSSALEALRQAAYWQSYNDQLHPSQLTNINHVDARHELFDSSTYRNAGESPGCVGQVQHVQLRRP